MTQGMNPAKMVEASRGLQPRYIKARIEAALVHARNHHLTREQREYWKAVANGLKELLK